MTAGDTNTAESWVPAIRRLVDQELADPAGSRPLIVSVPVGDLSTQSARDELRNAIETIETTTDREPERPTTTPITG